MKRTQVKVNLSLPFKALIEMMSSLELREKIKLRELLDRDIAITQQKTQNLPSQETLQELEPAIESFRSGWDDIMNCRTKLIAELWDGIDHITMQVTETTPNSSQEAIAENLISTF